MKTLFFNACVFACTLLFAASCTNTPKTSNASTMTPNTTTAESVYDFTVKDIDGKDVSLADFKGKNLMIVNVASKCGFTPQYEDLQQVHEKYGDKVVVLGFPANNFGGQEPGSNEEIKEFCSTKFGVEFPMFSKISVKGDDTAPLYKWLSAKAGEEPTWNFCKYVVTENGKKVQFYSSRVNPMEIAEKL